MAPGPGVYRDQARTSGSARTAIGLASSIASAGLRGSTRQREGNMVISEVEVCVKCRKVVRGTALGWVRQNGIKSLAFESGP